jgi:hypothetical protein
MYDDVLYSSFHEDRFDDADNDIQCQYDSVVPPANRDSIQVKLEF